jgi:kynurenine formamidase
MQREDRTMRKIVDLSGMIENNLWGYDELPGLEDIVPRVAVDTISTVEKNGFFSSRIVVATISGTYLEAGSHILEDGRNLDSYSIEDFVKPVKIIKLPEQSSKALIDDTLLESHAPTINSGDALIINTGWCSMWNKPGYVLQCPNMLRSALQWVLDKGISIFGIDVPCIEASWSEEDEEEKGGLLSEMFRQGVLLVAPLVNLNKIQADAGTLFCLPLSVKGTSGAPARVFYMEGDLK